MIKTFPLRFADESKLLQIGEIAKAQGISKEQFIFNAIDKQMPLDFVIQWTDGYGKCEHCPTCEEPLYSVNFGYCHYCGQRINVERSDS